YGFLAALPGIQISLQPWVTGNPGHPAGLPWAAGQPSVNCATQPGQQPGTVLTDSTGIATCTPVFGSQLGSGAYAIVVGGNFVNFGGTAFTVNSGPPAIMKIIAGNNQNVNPGVEATSAPGTVLTDSTGIATCTPVFGSQLGSGAYAIVVGGNFVNFGGTAFTKLPP